MLIGLLVVSACASALLAWSRALPECARRMQTACFSALEALNRLESASAALAGADAEPEPGVREFPDAQLPGLIRLRTGVPGGPPLETARFADPKPSPAAPGDSTGQPQ